MIKDLLANQKPEKRPRQSFTPIRRSRNIKGICFSLAETVLAKVKTLFFRVWDTIRDNFFRLWDVLRRNFSRLWDVFRSNLSRAWYVLCNNPLVPKVVGASVAALFVIGSISVVCFAISASEMPPGNLVSTLKDVSAYHLTSENSRSHVDTFSWDEDWTVFCAFEEPEYGAGTGAEIQDRSQDIHYPVRPGETLSEIAYAYGIPYDFLAWYNKIGNANRIRAGTPIIIPSLENTKKVEAEFAQFKTKQSKNAAATKQAARNIKNIDIAYESRRNGSANSGVTVHFSIVNPPANLRSFEWDLGDGKRSFRESPSYEYLTPKTYVARLTAQGSDGVIYKSGPLYVDIPYPSSIEEHSTVKFITLSAPDDYFTVSGSISAVTGYANVKSAPLDLSESDRFLTKVRFRKPGYYGLTVQQKEGNREQYYSIFVSPIATIHSDATLESFDWYRTQFNTGTPSNCGPASASMAIGWGTSNYFPVSSVRQAIGWQGDGGTSFEELLKVIKAQNVPAYITPLRTVQNIRDVIDSGGIAIILFHTGGISSTKKDPGADLFGKYYNDSVGHYVVIKGYSLNGEYFVIHDPIPSDWGANSFRYNDDISMIGRNRYYSANDVLRSLRRADMIVINQNKN